jgi:hypothetical protein
MVVHATLVLATVAAVAKIAPPKPVAPVESNGVRYSADRDGRDQYAVATDIATGKQLWKVKVFRTHIKFWIEEDVQWVFITDLKLMDNSLFVRDDKARCYALTSIPTVYVKRLVALLLDSRNVRRSRAKARSSGQLLTNPPFHSSSRQ